MIKKRLKDPLPKEPGKRPDEVYEGLATGTVRGIELYKGRK